jgi:hypothetical protein
MGEERDTTQASPGKPIEQATRDEVELTGEAAPPQGSAERSPRTRRCHALASAAFQVVGLTHTELMKN